VKAEYPENASYSRLNWETLAGFWHPVACSSDVGENGLVGAVLLDVPLILYRIAGQVTAAHDRCPHRGTRLSLGRIDKGKLVCPYHGIAFDAGGICRSIPSAVSAPDAIHYLDIPTFRSEERYGLIWVCLADNPMGPLPDWSNAVAPGNQHTVMHAVWEASPGRHLENFCDMAHFSFAHAGTFGVPEDPRVPSHAIHRSNHGFQFAADIPTRTGGPGGPAELFRNEYDITLPFAVCLTMRHSRGVAYVADAASPISLGRSHVFMVIARNHDLDNDIEAMIRAQHAVNEEDRFMVESQVPKGLPLVGNVERHISTDRFSVEYRKWWAGFGLTDPV
jgi:phenylpropionate dioxygenase-like ring-hydroxylating dioxygenase large terminal subunit